MNKMDQIINKLKTQCLAISSSYRPKIIFVGGIPGSGKDLLVEKSKLFFKNDSFYVIDVDLFRSYFSNYSKVEDTVTLSNRIEMELLNFLIENKKNIILVGTLRAYSYLNKIIIERIIPSGYEIFFHLLVTNQIESTLSAYERYVIDKQNGASFPRLSRLEYIEKSYNGFHNSINKYSENDYFSNNKLFIRGDNRSLPIELEYAGDINNAIMNEELRQLMNISNQSILDRIDNISMCLESSDEINEFKNICNKILIKKI